MLKNESTSNGAATDCAGFFGTICQTVNNRWRHNLMATWHTPVDVNVSLKWRYLSSVKLDADDQTINPGGNFNAFNARIGSYSYLDLFAEWKITKNYSLRGGVNNILDKDPPVLSSDLVSGGAANTYGIYDVLGRQWFLGVNAKF
jgi:outer membrane receptor protein involved in Fe transport